MRNEHNRSKKVCCVCGITFFYVVSDHVDSVWDCSAIIFFSSFWLALNLWLLL
jgi:hypothetical protein